MPAGLQEERESPAGNLELCSNSVQEKGQKYCISLFQKFQEATKQKGAEEEESKGNKKGRDVWKKWEAENTHRKTRAPLDALNLIDNQSPEKGNAVGYTGILDISFNT